MHAFLKLLPFFAFLFVLVYVIFELPQFSEYLIIVNELAERGVTLRLACQLILNFSLYAIFIYFLGRSIFSIATRGMEESPANNFVLFVGSVLLLLVPALALLLFFGGSLNVVFWGLAIFLIFVTIAVIPICSYASGIGPLKKSRWLDKVSSNLWWLDLVIVTLLLLVPLILSFDIVRLSHFTSLIGVTFTASALLFAAVHWAGRCRERSIPILSIIIIVSIVAHIFWASDTNTAFSLNARPV